MTDKQTNKRQVATRVDGRPDLLRPHARHRHRRRQGTHLRVEGAGREEGEKWPPSVPKGCVKCSATGREGGKVEGQEEEQDTRSADINKHTGCECAKVCGLRLCSHPRVQRDSAHGNRETPRLNITHHSPRCLGPALSPLATGAIYSEGPRGSKSHIMVDDFMCRKILDFAREDYHEVRFGAINVIGVTQSKLS